MASPCSLWVIALSWRLRTLGWLTALELWYYWLKYMNNLEMGSTLVMLLYFCLALTIKGICGWDSSPLTADAYTQAEQSRGGYRYCLTLQWDLPDTLGDLHHYAHAQIRVSEKKQTSVFLFSACYWIIARYVHTINSALMQWSSLLQSSNCFTLQSKTKMIWMWCLGWTL